MLDGNYTSSSSRSSEARAVPVFTIDCEILRGSSGRYGYQGTCSEHRGLPSVRATPLTEEVGPHTADRWRTEIQWGVCESSKNDDVSHFIRGVTMQIQIFWPKTVKIFTCNCMSGLRAGSRYCCYENVTPLGFPEHNLLRRGEFHSLRSCYQPGTRALVSSAASTVGRSCRVLSRSAGSGVTRVLTEGWRFHGEVIKCRR